MANELLRLLPRLLPPVLRARDFHLYLEGGRRLVDLWLYGGRAVLGHKPPHVLRELKNSGERGLFAPFPHILEERFCKALARLFPGPGLCFRLYESEASLRRALEEAGCLCPGEAVLDPAFSCPAGKRPDAPVLWRPFLGETEASSPGKLTVPVLPFPLAPHVLVIEKNLEGRFPPGDLIPPVLLAASARAVYDLLLYSFRKKTGYPKLKKALSAGVWRCQGIYLTPAAPVSEAAWASTWEKFLEKGFLIPPNPGEPLITPEILSPGEEAKLAALLTADIHPA